MTAEFGRCPSHLANTCFCGTHVLRQASTPQKLVGFETGEIGPFVRDPAVGVAEQLRTTRVGIHGGG
jgi:hypothetical protein